MYFNQVFLFELLFNGWRGSDLKAADAPLLGGPPTSSDPFIKFSIKRCVRVPIITATTLTIIIIIRINTCCCSRSKVGNVYRLGRGRGRSTKTDVQRNTLYPIFSNCRKPLYYLGTRAELVRCLSIVFNYHRVKRDTQNTHG